MAQDILVAGGGPVGLLLALRLVDLGLRPLVLERRAAPVPHSRSIGIHPPSLERLDALGVAAEVVREGVVVRRGHALGDGGRLGTLDFHGLPGPFDHVLACPQDRTEAVLEEALVARDPGALRREVEVVEVDPEAPAVRVRGASGSEEVLEARFLVGADGKDSLVRAAAGIAFPGERYPDTFVMGDFPDTTAFGPEAALFLSRRGLVECFPLPGGLRRWVARTDRYRGDDPRVALVEAVTERTGHDLSGLPDHMVSAFGVQHHLAEAMAAGPVALAGDAAHVVSPLGGQGMNAGWMDAWDLARVLRRVADGEDAGSLLRAYSRVARDRARRVTRRAELNMALGRGLGWMALRDLLVRAGLGSPASGLLARRFTMRGLPALDPA